MDEQIPLTSRQKNSLHDAVANPMRPPAFALMGEINPKMRVFVVHFDGTQNDKDHVPDGSIATLVADSYNHMRNDSVMTSTYHAGVGTRTSAIRGLLESMTGMGAQNRAEAAYAQLCEQTKEWRKLDPDCQVHVHVVGFSRGSGIGLHFMNLVHERGIKTNGRHSKADEGLMPGEVKTSAVLLDAVTTGNVNLKLTLPDSNVATLHITAGAEERKTFPLTTLKDPRAPDEIAMVKGIFNKSENIDTEPYGYQRLQEITLDGARHSDVGGSYREGGIRQVSNYLMGEFQRNLGLPAYARKPTFEEIEGMHANDSRFAVNKIADPFTSEKDLISQRQSAHRTVINRGEREWDGDAAVKCTLKDGDGTDLGYSRYQHCKLNRQKRLSAKANPSVFLSSEDLISAEAVSFETSYKTSSVKIILEDEFSSRQELTLKKATAETPPDRLFHGMEIVGAKADAFEVNPNGSMTFRGLSLPSDFSPSKLQAIIEDATNNQITICAEMEKTTPVFDVKHNVGNPKQLEETTRFLGGLSFQEDPWPTAVRDILYKLNDPDQLLSNRDAQMMNYKALEALSTRVLRNYGENANFGPAGEYILPEHQAQSIELRSEVIGGRQCTFDIRIKRKDGSVIKDTDTGMGAEDFLFLQEMKSMQRAMQMIDEGLHHAGHLTARPVHQVFTQDTTWDLSEKMSAQSNEHKLTNDEIKRMNAERPMLPSSAMSIHDPKAESNTMSIKNASGDDVLVSFPVKVGPIPGMGMFHRLSQKEDTEAKRKIKLMH